MTEKEMGKLPVIHFQPNGWYEAWLEDKAYQPKRRQKKVSWTESWTLPNSPKHNDFTDPEADSDAGRPKQPRKRRPKQRGTDLWDNGDTTMFLAGGNAADPSDKANASDPSATSDSSSSGTSGAEKSVGDSKGDDSASKGSSDPRAEVESKGDDSASSTSTPSSSTDEPSEQPHKRQRVNNRGFWIGCFHFCPKGNPVCTWQVKCTLNAHNKEGAKTFCNRAITFPAGDDKMKDLALRYCKDWCYWADDAETRKDHQDAPRCKLPRDVDGLRALPSNADYDRMLNIKYA